jgi:hypothetical protein
MEPPPLGGTRRKFALSHLGVLMPATPPETMKVIRTRSVDSLQRLYTVVVSLALAESLRSLLTGIVVGVPVGYERWLMFSSLIFTVVPFYHGANRYLDATYVTQERSAKPGALMIDFLILFLEGLGIFAISMLAPKGPEIFYTILAALFVLDAVWVGVTVLTSSSEEDKFPGYKKWALLNILAAMVLLFIVWSDVLDILHFKTDVAKNIALMSVAILRTMYDYIKVWSFYYPKGAHTQFEGLPAPAPAPPPHPVPVKT